MHFQLSLNSLSTFALLLGSGLGASITKREPVYDRQSSGLRYLNNATQKYLVKSLPNVTDPVGELYSGLITLKSNSAKSLFFMFQPSTQGASENLMTFIKGGPQCSSLSGFFGGLGKWNWLPGQAVPSLNPYSWTNVTNMLWVEEIPGVGYSQGDLTFLSTTIADDFVVFYEQFQDLFGIKNYKSFMTGDFYAGKTIPYIASAMHDKNDTSYFNLQGSFLVAPLISNGGPQEELHPAPFAHEYQNVIGLNDSTMALLDKEDEACGYAAYREKYFKFPAIGVQPAENSSFPFDTPKGCSLYGDIYNAVAEINPCFDGSNIVAQCPTPDDITQLSSEPIDGNINTQTYYNRPDVKAALHVPSNVTWVECVATFPPEYPNDYLATDPSMISTMPRMIENTNRTLFLSGSQDMGLVTNGTLISVQNMTWNGQLGFQQAPSTPLVVDGVTFGKQHFERGFMWTEVSPSGGEYADQPSVTYKLLQWVLGEIDEL